MLASPEIKKFRDLIEKKTGLYFSDSKLVALKNNLTLSFKDSTCPDYEEYYKLLNSDTAKGLGLLNQLCVLLTTGESYFFRDPAIFASLRNHLLPELVQRHKKNKTIKIWSAGCAAGEEAYSIAIILKEIIPDFNKWNILVLGTDINTQSIDKARQGIYRKWSLRDISISSIMKYFNPCGNHEYELKEEYRTGANFKYFNLCDFEREKTNLMKEIDLIICRNVLIYFREDAVKSIIRNFYNSLSETGYLIVGHTEHFSPELDKFKMRVFPDCHIYQKITRKSSDLGVKEKEKVSGLKSSSTIDLKALRLHTREEIRSENVEEERIIPRRKEEQGLNNQESILFEKGYKYFSNNGLESALKTFMDIIELNPHNDRAGYMIAYILANRGDLADAESWCNRVLIENSLFTEAYFLLALLKIALSDKEAAIILLKKVIFIEPDSPLAYIQLGNIFKDTGKDIQAKKMYQNARKYLEESKNGEGDHAGLPLHFAQEHLKNFVKKQLKL